jgi:hypothetical protein
VSGTLLAIYRLPIATAAEIGHVRVVADRHNGRYINGSKVLSTRPSGAFLVVTLANDAVYYVKAQDYAQVPAPKQRKR